MLHIGHLLLYDFNLISLLLPFPRWNENPNCRNSCEFRVANHMIMNVPAFRRARRAAHHPERWRCVGKCKVKSGVLKLWLLILLLLGIVRV